MGMTIENAIKHGQEQLEVFGGEHREFIETSLDTMRKYQKIEQIIRIYDTPWEFHTLRGTVDKIREVIEDGTDHT